MLNDESPIFSRPRIVNEHIEVCLDNDTIEESTSEFTSPHSAAKKARRFCKAVCR